MKNRHTILLIVSFHITACLWTVQAQEMTPSNMEQQLEKLTEADQGETEDDSWLQEIHQYQRHPVDLNTAGYDDLQLFRILSDLQIASFLSYRKLLGRFLSIYELQAIPAWDVYTIKKILPFICIGRPLAGAEELKKRFHNGDHELLFRFSQVLEKPVGYTSTPTGNYYLGSPQKLFFRYRYQYKNLLQYGLTGDKDAGEQFFRGHAAAGFDFYSFHLFVRKSGFIQSLALGDYTVSLGQGLIQWQGLAFRKGVDISGIKRQSPVLKPYSSAGEYNFHRGIGLTARMGIVETTAFVSFRNINANTVTDSIGGESYFTSFLMSGNNRTQNELHDRNSLRQWVFGGNMAITKNWFHIGVNGIFYNFSLPLQKRPEPYNLFAIKGKKWNNISVDYSGTYHNFHFFGETAIDKNYQLAMVHGLIISLDTKVDLSVFHRSLSAKYQSINGNAFTENSNPSNERGFYLGCMIRPVSAFRLDIYTDVYKFPWLRYLVDAPSSGRDYFVQLSFVPNKELEIYSHYHNERKQANETGGTDVTNPLLPVLKQDWRTQITYRINRTFSLRNRFELIWYNKKAPNESSGFLAFMDFIYKPFLRPYSATVRIQYFETTDYNSRLYAFENDVLYGYSIPAFSDRGCRYYLNLDYRFNKNIGCWLKWSQTVYQGKNIFGTGLDETAGKTRSEIRLQFVLYL